MIMVSDEELHYIATMLQKTKHKKYESFVINRIIHRLNEPDLHFTTQQLVRTKEKRYLLDLYFPQLKIAVEVDESFHKNQVKEDENREKEVIAVTEIDFKRICTGPSEHGDVLLRIEEVIESIRQKKITLEAEGRFLKYNYMEKYNTDYWLEECKLEVSDDARFRTHVDVARIFGKKYKGHQRAIIGLDENHEVWFPKLYKNNDWDNELSDDGKTIWMRKIGSGRYEAKQEKFKISYVFAHYRDEFGKIYYAFKGVFEVKLSCQDVTEYTRISDAIKFDGQGCFAYIK